MPEEATQAPAEMQDTPTPESAAPEGIPADQAPSDPYEKRYNDLRPQFDRASQEAAEYRQRVEAYEALHSGDPNKVAEAAEYLGIDLGEDEPDEYQDPYEDLLSKFQSLEQRLEAKEQAEQQSRAQQQRVDHVADQIDAIERAEKVSFKDDEVIRLSAIADSMPDAQGMPDVQAAYKWLTGYATDHAGELAARKRAAQAPQGEVRDRDIDMQDRNSRLDATKMAVERHMASQ